MYINLQGGIVPICLPLRSGILSNLQYLFYRQAGGMMMMKRLIVVVLLLAACKISACSQSSDLSPDQSFWIIVSDQLRDSAVMVFRCPMACTYCIDDGTNGTTKYWESIAPPLPPSGLDTRWRGIRGRWIARRSLLLPSPGGNICVRPETTLA